MIFFILLYLKKNTSIQTSRLELFYRFEEGRNIFTKYFSVWSVDDIKLVRDRQKYIYLIIKKKRIEQ